MIIGDQSSSSVNTQQQHHAHPSSSSCGSNHVAERERGTKQNSSNNCRNSSQHISLPVRCEPRSNCVTASISNTVCSIYRNHVKEINSLDWSKPSNLAILLAHGFQLGILWRYLRLFVPVNLMTVKHEVRDLCMLRMVHGFCEAAPMLLIQVYLMCITGSPNEIRDLDLISTFLSLFAVCWALASFSKNARRKNVHKMIMTWLGVIFQFCWRIG